MGRVTREIELKYTQSGLAVTELGLATNHRRKDQAGEWVEESVFVDVTLWGRTAEIASEYLSKGSPVFIEGRLKFDTWETDGQKRSKLRVVGERMQLLGSRGDRPAGGGSNYNESAYSQPASAGASEAPAPEAPASEAPAPDAPRDDIPF